MINVLNTFYPGAVIQSIISLQKTRSQDQIDKCAIELCPEFAEAFKNFKTIVSNRNRDNMDGLVDRKYPKCVICWNPMKTRLQKFRCNNHSGH